MNVSWNLFAFHVEECSNGGPFRQAKSGHVALHLQRNKFLCPLKESISRDSIPTESTSPVGERHMCTVQHTSIVECLKILTSGFMCTSSWWLSPWSYPTSVTLEYKTYLRGIEVFKAASLYKGRLKISWTHLITPSQNFVEVWWHSLFQSTSLGKRCTSCNSPPTSWQCAADHWSLRNFMPWSSPFLVRRVQKSHGVRSGLYGGCSDGVPLIYFFQAKHRIQFRSRLLRFLSFSNHEKGTLRKDILRWSTVCNTFSRSGWSIVRSASLAKGDTLEKILSLHLHRVLTQSNKVSLQSLQMALVFKYSVVSHTILHGHVSCVSWSFYSTCAVFFIWKFFFYIWQYATRYMWEDNIRMDLRKIGL
jgi:hypothetical protein